MDVVRAVRIAGLMASPTVIIWLGIHVPKVISGQLQARRDRQERSDGPHRPPIEQLAADLRRLLTQYDVVRRSSQVAMRAHHLWALEAAVTDAACAAADALGVAYRPRGPHGRLPATDLQRLICALHDAGLVLPSTVSWLAPDG